MSNCPDTDALSALVFGTLADAALVSVSEHLTDCDHCQRAVEELESQSDALLDVLRQAIPEEPLKQEDGWTTSIQRAEAILESDTAAIAGEATHIVPRKPGHTREPDGTVPDLDLGQYRLLRKLGQGGMGAVYEAVHLPLDKLVAIKILPPSRTVDEQAVSRFQREMRAVGRVAHPNIVAALDAGEVNEIHFLVMERVDGADVGSIGHRLKRLRIDDACEIVRQAALGLQHAHDNGLVHRDIKPSNLMLSREDVSDGRLKILDLGLALLSEHHAETDGLTGTGQVMGTIDYMAPEQADDTHRVDGRADVYSLGATLYRLLGGRAPLAGEESGILQRLSALATREPDPITNLRPDVPARLADLITRMLSKSPSGRPDSPGQVAEELQLYTSGTSLDGLVDVSRDEYEVRLESETVAVEQEPVPAGPERRRRRTPAIAALGIACTMGAAFLIPDVRKLITDSHTSERVPPGTQTVPPPVPTLPESPSPPGTTPPAVPETPSIAKTDYALYFDGVDDYVELPPIPIEGDSPLTLECLVTMARDYPERAISTNGMAHIAGWQNLQAIKIVCYENGPGAKLMRDYDPVRKTYSFTYIKSSNSIVGRTVHLSAVYMNRQFTFYVDGEKVDTRSYEPYRKPFEGAFLGGYIDRRGAAARFASDMAFHGTIDEVRLSNKARPPVDPGDRPRHFERDEYTLALYHCDNTDSSDTLVDSSGNNHHAKVYGATRIPLSHKFPDSVTSAGGQWLDEYFRTNPWGGLEVPVAPPISGHGEYICYRYDLSGEVSTEVWSIAQNNELTTPAFVRRAPTSQLGYGTCIYDHTDGERLWISPYCDGILTATIQGASSNRRVGMLFRDQDAVPVYAPAGDTRRSRLKYTHSVSVSSDGRFAATIDASGDVTELVVHDLESPNGTRRLALPDGEILHYGVEFLSNDMLAAGTVSGDILIFDLASDAVVERIERSGRVRSMDLSLDGARLAIGGESEVGTVEIWDIRKRSLVCRVDEQCIIRAVRFSPDGRKVAAAADNDVIVCDSNSGTVLGRTSRLPDLRSLEFTPDGELLVLPEPISSRNPYSTLLAIDIDDLRKPPRKIIQLRHSTYHALSMHPTLPIVALSQTYGVLFINTVTGDVVAAWNVPQPTYWSSDFSADGSTFATVVSSPGGICIWETENFKATLGIIQQ